MSEQTVSWRTKQISSVFRELKHELHEILMLFLKVKISDVIDANTHISVIVVSIVNMSDSESSSSELRYESGDTPSKQAMD